MSPLTAQKEQEKAGGERRGVLPHVIRTGDFVFRSLLFHILLSFVLSFGFDPMDISTRVNLWIHRNFWQNTPLPSAHNITESPLSNRRVTNPPPNS